MDDLRVVVAVAGFLLTLIGYVYARAEKSNKTLSDVVQRTHNNEIALERMRAEVAEKYATKAELKELKEFITGRFDRLETKLDRERTS
ncbi:hypothetical protein LRP50_05170 [Enterovibrio sp. ZSDZ42]|uniref:Nitrite reductase n=1 Tax=Enterovibrio gelatinilyticus TaxID=2899819 RepID=A0ABT5QWW9_9GAMM|nr:hypothetical protein [Enterovibrio sp. ZSDZ42]MDD1792518.1 hypothetical protein [Enterovibrio sp. ZSDZ42]